MSLIKPKQILLTNDDGIDSPAFPSLISCLRNSGTLMLVAPSGEMSGVSHGLTIDRPIRCRQARINGLGAFAISGTPVDCVKLAMDSLMTQKPDLVISGINRGANTGVNVFYSGTVAAAMEAAISGIPAIAVSVASKKPRSYDVAAGITAKLAANILKHGLPPGLILNVNIPSLELGQIKGFRLTSQSDNRYHDRYVREDTDDGESVYYLAGDKISRTGSLDQDDTALTSGWVSVSPLQADFNVEIDIDDLNNLLNF